MRWTAALFAAVLCACPPPAQLCDGGACPPGPCGAGALQNANGECQAAGPAACATGFEADPSGWGCDAVASAPCDAGSLSVPGEACAPVGWSLCPLGFTASGDGWSCAPVLPTAACTGATRAALGATTCQSVGDCAAPFPPAAATLFVDASLDGGALDATHFNTISAALAAAPSGATIAVAPGTYLESVAFTKPVTLLGRCPAQVTVTGSPGLEVNAVTGVTVEGVTVRDSVLGARVEHGGALTLRHMVLEANFRSGVQAIDNGTQLVMEDVVLRGTRADTGTGTFGQGLAASFAAQLTLTDVELTLNRETGLFLDRASTHASLTRSVISGTQPRASTGRLGWGVGVQGGASLDGTQVVVTGNTAAGLLVAQAPTRVTLTDTVVSHTALGLDNTGAPAGMGVMVSLGGTLTWTGGAVEDAPLGLLYLRDPATAATVSRVTLNGGQQPPNPSTFGASAQDSAQLSMDHCAVLQAQGSSVSALTQGAVTLDHVGLYDSKVVGLRAQDSGRITGTAVEVRRHGDAAALALKQGTLALSRCVLAESAGLASADGGVSGFGAATSEQGTVSLDACLVDHNAGAGLYATSGAHQTVTNSVVRDTQLTASGEFGQGAVVEHGGLLDLTDATLARNHTAGLQVTDTSSAITALRIAVRGTLADQVTGRGRGANAQFGGALTVTSSAFVDSVQVGVFAFQSRVELTDSVVQNTLTSPDGSYGNAVEALTDGVIVMTRGALDGSAGIAAVFAEGAGALDGVRISRAPVGLHVQDGSAVDELDAVPAQLGSRQVVVTHGTTFVDTRAKQSEGTVSVPPP